MSATPDVQSETLDELRHRQKRAVERSRELVNRAEADDRALSAEELAEWESLNTGAQELFRRIAVQEKQTVLERDLSRPANRAPGPDLGIDAVPLRERRNYSLSRVAEAVFSKEYRKAPFEMELHEELRKHTNREARGLLVPYWALIPTAEQYRAIQNQEARTAISVSLGTAPPAADLVPTDHLGDSFIEILRNASATGQLGSTVLTNLRGNVDIPRQATAASAAWLATENADAAESNATFDDLNLTPKDVALFTDITRRTIQQGVPGIEGLIRLDQQRALGTAIDVGAINGSGSSGQPTGILQTSGIGSVTTSGTVTWANAIEFETDVAAANALMGSLGYLLRAELAGVLKGSVKVSGDAGAGFIIDPDGRMNGYRVARSQNCPKDLGTGTDKQAMIFGNWSDLIIAEWGGGIDILVDPYTLGKAGAIRMVGYATIDVGVRHAASFSAATDVNE
jgi:HK97 family phage major capsid protein